MELGYGRLLEILCGLHPHLRQASVIARLQYFQRQGFPLGRSDRSALPRADYGPAGLMRLALAFEILAAGAPPGIVAELVSSGWLGAQEHMAAGWLQRKTRDDALPIFVRVNGVGGKRRDAGDLRAGDMGELRAWGHGGGDLRALLIVDALRVAKAVHAVIAGDEGSFELASIEKAIDEWAQRARSS